MRENTIIITNNSDEALNLEDLNLKYFGVCEEGKDYTFNGANSVKIKSSVLEKFKDEDAHYFSFKFDNNIKRILPVIYDKMTIPEYFNVSIGDTKNVKNAYRNNLIMVPVKVSNNVGDILTKCDFNLKYDKDIFKDAYVICNDEKVKSKVDLENGVVNVTYDKQDPELSAEKICDPVYGNQIDLYLALQVRDDTAVGDTVIGFEENKGFQIRNSFNGAVVTHQGSIAVKPVEDKEKDSNK